MPAIDGTNSTSVSLLKRIELLDLAAWERFSKLYSPIVYRWCRQTGLQDSDVADVMQEVFRAVASGIATFSAGNSQTRFRAWLWGITKNKLADHYRRASRRVEATGGTDAQARMSNIADVCPDDPASESLFDTDAAILHRALDLLKTEFESQTWQAFWRMTIGGEKASDVAVDLGMSAEAVRQAKFRVLRRLRVELHQLK